MTPIAIPPIYERALVGEPVLQIVRESPSLDTNDGFWTLGEWDITIPAPDMSPAPEMRRTVSEIRRRTGWSARGLAEIVGTSHTTILGIEGGRRLFSTRSGDLRRRLSETNDLVARIYAIAGRSQEATADILEQIPASGRSAIDLLQSDEASRAYLAAIDVARPRPPGLLAGSRPRRDGATAPLHE